MPQLLVCSWCWLPFLGELFVQYDTRWITKLLSTKNDVNCHRTVYIKYIYIKLITKRQTPRIGCTTNLLTLGIVRGFARAARYRKNDLLPGGKWESHHDGNPILMGTWDKGLCPVTPRNLTVLIVWNLDYGLLFRQLQVVCWWIRNTRT